MRRSVWIMMMGILLCVMPACQQIEERGPQQPKDNMSLPDETIQDGVFGFPLDHGPSTKEEKPASEKEHVEQIAKEHGFTPVYMTFGTRNNRHAYLFVEMDPSWDEETKERHLQNVRNQFEKELPQLEVTIHVVNDGSRN